MLVSKKNTLFFRAGTGAALLAVFVAVGFVALMTALSAARDTDRATSGGRNLITKVASARIQVATTRGSDAVGVRRASRAADVAAAATAASPQMGAEIPAEIQAAANAYESDPLTARTALITSLSRALSAQASAEARRSASLDSDLQRALLLGIVGLAGSLLTILLFGADLLRSGGASLPTFE